MALRAVEEAACAARAILRYQSVTSCVYNVQRVVLLLDSKQRVSATVMLRAAPHGSGSRHCAFTWVRCLTGFNE